MKNLDDIFVICLIGWTVVYAWAKPCGANTEGLKPFFDWIYEGQTKCLEVFDGGVIR